MWDYHGSRGTSAASVYMLFDVCMWGITNLSHSLMRSSIDLLILAAWAQEIRLAWPMDACNFEWIENKEV